MILPAWYPSERSPDNGDFVKYQVKLLREAGINVDVAYADISVYNVKRNQKEAIVNQYKNGIDYLINKWSIPRNNKAGLIAWRKLYIHHIENYINTYGLPDLIHAHVYLAAWIAAYIKDRYDIPFYYTEHYSGFIDGSIAAAHREIAEIGLQNAQRVFAVGSGLRDALEEIHQRKIDIVPNFIDFDLFRLQPKETTDQIRAITIGSLIERKQINHIVKAMVNLPAYTLTIIGDGPERASLENLVRQYGMKDRIHFLGPLCQEEVANELSQHDVLLHPSRAETFGITLIEAMASGLPVIAYQNGGSQDIITPETGILVEAINVEAFKEAMNLFQKDQYKYDPEHIRRHAAGKYSVEFFIADCYR